MNSNHLEAVTLKDLWAANIEGYAPILLEVYNPDINWGNEKDAYEQDNCYLRLIADDYKVKYNGKVWLPCNFEYTEPETDGSKIGTSQITITAIDVRVKRILKTMKIPSVAKVIASFIKITKDSSSGKFYYKFAPLNTKSFTMSSANSNSTTATFNLEFETSLQQNVPYEVATADRVPGTKG